MGAMHFSEKKICGKRKQKKKPVMDLDRGIRVQGYHKRRKTTSTTQLEGPFSCRA